MSNYRISIVKILSSHSVQVQVFKQHENFSQTVVSEFRAYQEPHSFAIKPIEGKETFNMLDEPIWEKIKIVVQAFIDGMNQVENDSYWLLNM